MRADRGQGDHHWRAVGRPYHRRAGQWLDPDQRADVFPNGGEGRAVDRRGDHRRAAGAKIRVNAGRALRRNALKITNIRSIVVNAEMRNWIFVRVETDQAGLFGWGEATLEWKTRSVAAAVGDLAPLVIGRDPRDIEKLVRIMKKHSFWRLGAIGMSAISGIENALWDLYGNSLAVPVWMLLGRPSPENLPAQPPPRPHPPRPPSPTPP